VVQRDEAEWEKIKHDTGEWNAKQAQAVRATFVLNEGRSGWIEKEGEKRTGQPFL
jgi:hypothetical protein